MRGFSIVVACLVSFGWDQIFAARGPIQEAFQNGLAAQYRPEDCVWRREYEHRCPDPDIHVYLHKLGKERIELQQGSEESRDWLNNVNFDPGLDNVFLIHGFNGGDGVMPTAVLRDAYVRNGSYNVFAVDWGAMVKSPCYPAAVANIRFVGSCLAKVLTNLRDLGMSVPRTSCVGHSLGAHLCGVIANYLPFRWERIFGLDPARPLISPSRLNRLDITDAKFVCAVRTNTGYYGDSLPVGHVDMCANGGKAQPSCSSAGRPELCSHNWSLCFMADSLDGRSELYTEPCSARCPPLRRIGPRGKNSLVIGHNMPDKTRGTYCVSTDDFPYCPKSDNDRGDERCCHL
ncbi:phospholipase A1 member A-like [Neodiprion fabricii]|uniref:phospholipase A1 member A-like n=1 Tax=Neodiprion fabricii TaxID=2872261 RepID=UPI001ED8D83B|nr:phospholipase A1 member A-like [Neodiprion fabricii]